MGEEFITDSMLDMFLYESDQNLEQLEEITLEHKDDSGFDEDSINEIFRIMHTLKGSSGMMMYNNITTISHKLEDIFYYLRESHPEKVPHQELVAQILDVSDFIKEELEKIREGENPDGDPSELIERMERFLNHIKGKGGAVQAEIGKEKASAGKEGASSYVAKHFYIAPVAEEDSHFYKIVIRYSKDTEMSNIKAYTAVYGLKEVAEDLLFMPEDIMTNEESGDYILEHGFTIALQTKLGKEEVRKLADRTSGIEELTVEEVAADQYLQICEVTEEGSEGDGAGTGTEEEYPETIELESAQEKKDYVIRPKNPAKKPARPAKKADHGTQGHMSVPVEKMDQLMDLIGEIVIAEAMVLQNPDLKVPGLELTNFYKASGQLSKITTELQDVIMSMRMMPLTNTFQKMNRIVFDMTRKLNKDVELEIVGAETEVDKNIIEHISDPLMHLMRNAIDHGIESKEERLAAGKQERGRVVLEAKNEGGKVWITVQDNGQGLSREKLLKKARENGLLDDRPESDYTDKEVYSLITLPGFSTNKVVTEYSGRGVGMDVVVQNIQKVGGSLEIDSVEGEGTTMIMKIPLTLAIMDGIIVGIGRSTFVVATNSVKEFLRVTREQLTTEPSGEEFVMIREECYPVVRLAEFYKIKNAATDLEDGVMIILEHEGKRVSVFVDSLIGEQEIVVKPIPSYIKKVKGISGCTQLGDGSISLILDAGDLLQD